MKKVLKITGVAVLALILICNLEYALFSGDIKNTPNKAFADWYNYGTHYCGSSPNTDLITGIWHQDYSTDYYYYRGCGYLDPNAGSLYWFEENSTGTDCGNYFQGDHGISADWISAHGPEPLPYNNITGLKWWNSSMY